MTEVDSRHTRQGRLALAYKYMVKRILDAAEMRYGQPLDKSFREAVMVEAQVFFALAKQMLSDEDPIHEQFYHIVAEQCRLVQISRDRDTSSTPISKG